MLALGLPQKRERLAGYREDLGVPPGLWAGFDAPLFSTTARSDTPLENFVTKSLQQYSTIANSFHLFIPAGCEDENRPRNCSYLNSAPVPLGSLSRPNAFET